MTMNGTSFSVTEDETKSYDNVAELLSAVADNGYLFDVSDEAMSSYKTSVTFRTTSTGDLPPYTGAARNDLGLYMFVVAFGLAGGVGTIIIKHRAGKK